MTLTMSKTSMVAVRGEPELVAATRAGDDRAFEELYARYRERIFAFILSRVRDHGRAEDIAQEVFISALRRLRTTEQPIAFKPWLYEIAKNACIDEFRRGTRAREIPLETDGDLTAERPTTLSALPTPAAAVESKQRISDLQGAFSGLSDSHHQLLVLREFEGLSYDEIGERLDMTRQMVESGLFRARRKLTEEYQELASGRRCQQVQLAIDTGVMASARALGVRERRRFQRHLSHCQACRHVALQAGVDEALVKPRRIPAKIAALLPLPLWRRLMRGLGARGSHGASGGSHAAASMSARAAGVAEPAAGSALSLGPAAVTAVALAIAGAGGVLVHGAIDSHHVAPPVSARPAASTAPIHQSRAVTSAAAARNAAGLRHAGAALTSTGALTHSGKRGSAARHRGSRSGGGAGGGGSASSSRSSSGVTSRLQGASAHVLSATSAVGTVARPLVSATKQTLNSATKTLTSTAQTLTSTVQKVTSSTQQAVSGVGTTVSKTTGAVGSTATNTLQGAGKTAGGAVGAVSGAASGLAPSSSSSSTGGTSSGTSTASSSPLSTAGQAVNKTAQSLTSAAGQAVGGLTK